MKQIRFLFLFIYSLLAFTTYAQENVINDDEYYIYKAPSENYKSIYLDKYKDSPIFSDHIYQALRSRSVEFNTNNFKDSIYFHHHAYEAYYELVKFKYTTDLYQAMDKNKITKLTVNSKENDLESTTAQQLFSKFYTYAVTNKGKLNINKNLKTRDEKFADLVEKNFDTLKNWSKTVFKNDSQTAYLVIAQTLTNYNLDKEKGFFTLAITTTQILPAMGWQNSNSLFANFTPKQAFEKKLVPEGETKYKNYYTKTIKFKPETNILNMLMKRQLSNYVYLVFKVNINYNSTKGFEDIKALDYLYFTYNYDSPIVEVYQDVKLMDKVGEINLENDILE